jgi:isocitrate dehydrogenase
VNPVLREGNSDRRAAKAVKAFARPTRTAWATGRPTARRAWPSMSGGDFFAPTRSRPRWTQAATAKIVLTTDAGEETLLKEGVSYPAGTVVDATFMSPPALDAFLAEEIEKTKAEGVPVLAAHEGHDDEGLGPDHLRPCGQGLAGAGLREFGDGWMRWA